MFGAVHMMHEKEVRLINEVTGDNKPGYCNKCGKSLHSDSLAKANREITEIREKLQKIIHHIPLSTIQSPLNRDYEVIGMVTGQATAGTGVISEFTSAFTDLFGAQSGRYNQKIKYSEQLCAAQIRQQTLDSGGNAIVGVDIDYSEVGGDKGMLMVCMAGTAVKINNTDILKEKAEVIEDLVKANTRHRHLSFLVRHTIVS
jgi:uncharacterized protein YbjQ (UPF0145 family)